MVKVGDRVIVHGWEHLPVHVDSIQEEPGGRTAIHLDWKEYGKSRVYLHDEYEKWHSLQDDN